MLALQSKISTKSQVKLRLLTEKWSTCPPPEPPQAMPQPKSSQVCGSIPVAALYTGDWTGMKFFEGAPVFAVEVRSEGDYGPAAEKAMAKKRADYFAAGSLIVWDVDLLEVDVIKSY